MTVLHVISEAFTQPTLPAASVTRTYETFLLSPKHLAVCCASAVLVLTTDLLPSSTLESAHTRFLRYQREEGWGAYKRCVCVCVYM